MKTMLVKPDTLIDLDKNKLADDQKEELKDMVASAGVKWILLTLAEICGEQAKLAFEETGLASRGPGLSAMWKMTEQNILNVPEVIS